MMPLFSVRRIPQFDRLFRRLDRQHPDFMARYAAALHILGTDPYNRTRTHGIKKLNDVQSGNGQYRLRLGRFRFRYDIKENEVVLSYCGLRREDTYQ